MSSKQRDQKVLWTREVVDLTADLDDMVKGYYSIELSDTEFVDLRAKLTRIGAVEKVTLGDDLHNITIRVNLGKRKGRTLDRFVDQVHTEIDWVIKKFKQERAKRVLKELASA